MISAAAMGGCSTRRCASLAASRIGYETDAKLAAEAAAVDDARALRGCADLAPTIDADVVTLYLSDRGNAAAPAAAARVA